MKKKISKIMGIGLAFVLLASLLTFAIPVSAGPYDSLSPMPNTWFGHWPTPSGPTTNTTDQWFFDPAITKVGPIAQAYDIDGDGVATLYAYVANATGASVDPDEIFTSKDNGRTWSTSTTPGQYSMLDTNTVTAGIQPPGPVVDMVCSSISEDVIYLTDGNYVYKSVDGGMNFAFVAQDDLEKNLMGDCGIPITGQPITCIDVGYDGADKPVVFIGTRAIAGRTYDPAHPNAGDFVVGSVYWIADETFPASWTDLELKCYGCCDPELPDPFYSQQGCYDVYSVGVAPTFATTNKVYVLITKPTTLMFPLNSDDVVTITAGAAGATISYTAVGADLVTYSGAASPDDIGAGLSETFTADGAGAAVNIDVSVTAGSVTFSAAGAGAVDATICPMNTEVVFTVGTVCSWNLVSQLRWDCVNDDAHRFEICHGSRFAFPSYYSTDPTMFIGVAGIPAAGLGGDVYRVEDTYPAPNIAIDLNVQGPPGCTGMYHANICSLDIENDYLVAGAWDSFQLQTPCRVYYSTDGGWGWSKSAKDPTGDQRTYVLFVGGGVVAATEGCDCAFSLSCGTPEATFFNQISLINMDIDQVLDLSHSPGYIIDSSTMYALTTADPDDCEGTCGPADSFSLTATAASSTAEVLVNSGSVYVTLLNDPDVDVTITYDWDTQTYEISLPDIDDAVLVTAASVGTNVTASVTAGAVAIAEVTDCDPDMGADFDVAFDMDAGHAAIRSLLRWDNTYWERVHSSRAYVVTAAAVILVGGPLYDWVEVSPDFNDTSCLYMANTGFQMTRSLDAGCSWAPILRPCEDRPDISAWIVVDLETVLAAGAGADAGTIFKTTSHGSQPWLKKRVPGPPAPLASDGVDFDLSVPRGVNSDVLFGDDTGHVYLSTDLGDTWTQIIDWLTGSFSGSSVNTYVVFDPGYGTAGDPGENTVYAAGGSIIGRCAIDFDAALATQDWLYLSNNPQADCDAFDLCVASGIDAAGDTALYVSDSGSAGTFTGATVCGTMVLEYLCDTAGDDTAPYETCYCDVELDDSFTPLGPSYSYWCGDPFVVISYDLQCYQGDVIGTIVVEDLVTGSLFSIEFTAADPLDIPGDCTACEPTGPAGIVHIISSDLRICCEGTIGCDAGVWRTLNPLDVIDEKSGLNLVEFEFWNFGTSVPQHPVADAFGVFPDDLWLTQGSNVLWVLDATNPTWILNCDDLLAAPVIQIGPADGSSLAFSTMATLEWEKLDNATLYQVVVYKDCPECLTPLGMLEVLNTTTAATCLEVTGLLPGTLYYWKVRVACDSPLVSKWSELWSFNTALDATGFCSPECGAENISLTPNFSWYKVTGATGYEIEVSLTEDFSSLIASGTPTINAWDGIPELEYSTTYYWRVRAVKDGVPSAWTYCLFSTIAEPTVPVTETVTPVTVVTEEISPVWIWVIIGIGAALVIAVIILIVTTRRVS